MIKLITINGVTITTPSTYQIGIQDISKALRNANGDAIIERVTTKKKLELSWNYLTQSELATLLTAISSVFFTVTYPDSQEGAIKSGTFYVGDRISSAIDYKAGVIRWKDIKFNVIER